MKNTIVTLTAFFFHTALLHAQHCPWDGLSAIIVDVRNSTGQQVDGLDVFLADSAGTAYKSIWNRTKSKGLAIFRDTDTLIFGKNSKMQMNADTSSSALFPFAEGMYMLVVYPGNYPQWNKTGKDVIVIGKAGRDGSESGVPVLKIPLRPENITYLCTSAPVWNDKRIISGVKINVTILSAVADGSP